MWAIISETETVRVWPRPPSPKKLLQVPSLAATRGTSKWQAWNINMLRPLGYLSEPAACDCSSSHQSMRKKSREEGGIGRNKRTKKLHLDTETEQDWNNSKKELIPKVLVGLWRGDTDRLYVEMECRADAEPTGDSPAACCHRRLMSVAAGPRSFRAAWRKTALNKSCEVENLRYRIIEWSRLLTNHSLCWENPWTRSSGPVDIGNSLYILYLIQSINTCVKNNILMKWINRNTLLQKNIITINIETV